MAGRARLSASAAFAALVVLVLLVHVISLDWLARQLKSPSLLQPMATPMFTRLLSPQAPAAAPAPQVKAVVRAKPRRSKIASVARPAAAPSSAAAASAPDLRPPEVAASQPEATPSTPPGTPTATATATALPASAPASAASPVAGPDLDTWPADTRLNYRLSGNYRGELYGSARVQWQRQAERYQARVEIDLTLFRVVLTSQGEVAAQGLSPQVYEEQRPGNSRGVRLGETSIVSNDGRSFPRPPQVQDTASQFVELSHRFATGQEPLEVGRSVQLWLARPGGVDLWIYDVVERETLQTPELGGVEAFHLKPRMPANPRGNITAEMWFAPSLQYLPVRIRVNMGPDIYVDLIVQKIEQR